MSHMAQKSAHFPLIELLPAVLCHIPFHADGVNVISRCAIGLDAVIEAHVCEKHLPESSEGISYFHYRIFDSVALCLGLV